MIRIILVILAGLYTWKENLFGVRYKKDISSADTTREIEEYFEHTTEAGREEDVREYQEQVLEEQEAAQESVVQGSYPIADVLRMLGMSQVIYPEYPGRVSKHLLDTPVKQQSMKRHLMSLQPLPAPSPVESAYNDVPVSSQQPKFQVGHRIIYTRYNWKWGEIWQIDEQKYYVKNYTGSGLTGTDTPFPGKWVIYRTNEKYMRLA